MAQCCINVKSYSVDMTPEAYVFVFVIVIAMNYVEYRNETYCYIVEMSLGSYSLRPTFVKYLAFYTFLSGTTQVLS